jgi:hypothetical protein
MNDKWQRLMLYAGVCLMGEEIIHISLLKIPIMWIQFAAPLSDVALSGFCLFANLVVLYS